MHLERRELRSDDPADAIRIFLARNGTDEGLRAAVVSNDDGELLGGVGDGDLDTLAALGSAVTAVRGSLARNELCGVAGIDAAELHVVRLGVGGRNFVITSVGAPFSAAGPLGAALDRILDAAA
jgi:hypothetical protein